MKENEIQPVDGNLAERSTVDDEDHDGSDDDDDNWSRQVETDETVAGTLILHDDSYRPESIVEEDQDIPSPGLQPPLAPSTPPELSLKEKLVLRERQRRIETERARLKRQFALNHGIQEEDEPSYAAALPAENGSVTETLGEESMRAHPDEESKEESRLGFNMERFLRNSDSFHPELETTDETHAMPSDQGVLMERFLNDPVVVASTDDGEHEDALDINRSVSYDADAGPEGLDRALDVSTFEDQIGSVDANVSVHAEADDEQPLLQSFTPQESGLEHGSTSIEDPTDEPRVLRLTEADMQEMASIEDASIGNAPPSEREEEEMLSEIGELMHFTGQGLENLGTFSQGDTTTTAMESSSVLSGNQSVHQASASSDHDPTTDHRSLDGMAIQPPPSVTTPVRSSNGGPTDITPPRMTTSEEEDKGEDMNGFATDAIGHVASTDSTELSHEDENDQIVNRRLRPGMMSVASAGLRLSEPTPVQSPDYQKPLTVADFDFDKDAPTTPVPVKSDDSYRNLPDDEWSPSIKMQLSPLQTIHPPTLPAIHEQLAYGTIEEGRGSGLPSQATLHTEDEGTPLLHDVPPEIIARVGSSTRRKNRASSVISAVQSVFSDIRSEELNEKEEIQNESEMYFESSTFSRAVPERLFALIVTLMFEIPVLLMISGGSEALCALVGRRRYSLLMGFIPLTSAISGNVGLQASTLTTRAISHRQVTETSYAPWFLCEIGAAAYLGLGMGLLLGSIAFFASEMDPAFGLTICFAQFISIVTAGITGTFAPLLFSFIFRRDSGKWGGPLETAIQDIVGSFAMVVISYKILLLLGDNHVDPDDVCGPASMDSMD